MRKVFVLFLFKCLLTFTVGQPFDSNDHFPSARIVGGTEIEISETPWLVSLQKCSSSSSSSSSSRCVHNCGGFIIDKKWIMTAGHCISYDWYKVRIGTKDNTKGGLLVDVKQMIRHYMFNSNTIDYDYGLLELSEPLNFTDNVKAIALPSEKDTISDGTLCKLSGWGATYNNSEPMNRLRKLTHPITNQKKCADDVPKFMKLTPRMICAGPRGDGKSGCFGDSGSALTCKLKDGTRKVVGIASWVTAGCLGPKNRTVYARVQAARRWIKYVSGV